MNTSLHQGRAIWRFGLYDSVTTILIKFRPYKTACPVCHRAGCFHIRVFYDENNTPSFILSNTSHCSATSAEWVMIMQMLFCSWEYQQAGENGADRAICRQVSRSNRTKSDKSSTVLDSVVRTGNSDFISGLIFTISPSMRMQVMGRRSFF